jgi:hypothetical protein
MARRSKPIKVAIKYCGCCNPQVNLSKIAHYLADMSETNADFVLVPLAEDTIDVAVILCGCPRACGNKEDVKARAKYHLLVAGESLNGKAVQEEHIPQSLLLELKYI